MATYWSISSETAPSQISTASACSDRCVCVCVASMQEVGYGGVFVCVVRVWEVGWRGVCERERETTLSQTILKR